MSNVQNSETKQSRRRFIKRTGTASLLAALPSTAAWGNGLLAGSIVASGNGSDYSGGGTIAILSPGKWKNQAFPWPNLNPDATFFSVFGGVPFGTLKDSDGNTLSLTQLQQIKCIDILRNPGGNGTGSNDKLGGPSNVNEFLVQTYLNAVHHGLSFGGELINFPVIQTRLSMMDDARGLFASDAAFADYLYGLASNGNEGALGAELSAFLNANHA